VLRRRLALRRWSRLARREPLLDPTGDGDGAADNQLSPRLGTLSGLRVGLLDNTKPNAAVLLGEVAAELRRGWGVSSSSTYVKSYFGTPVEESLIQRILKNSDFVVAGIGD
jgi:hypothetical protein